MPKITITRRETVPIQLLKENPDNPRKITRKELAKLVKSIEEFGFVQPLIVNEHPDRHNIVIGGHQRLKAAKKLGLTEVPVVYVNLPKDKEQMLNIALNKISGEWDDLKLQNLIQEILSQNLDATITGFDEPEIAQIIAAMNSKEQELLKDVVPEPPKTPKSKPGEIYQIGPHRIMCGDATNPEHFEQLMNGQKAHLTWTDPPYGVSYSGTNNPNGRPWGIMTNDQLRGNKLFQFLYKIYKNSHNHTTDNAPLYTCYASINHIIFEKALNEAGYTIKQQLIWEKGHILGHSDYHWSHEPILYCRKAKNPEWYGDRTHKTFILNSNPEEIEKLKKEELIKIIKTIKEQSDILHIKKDPASQYLHATQKPADLPKIMIQNSTRPKQIVLDPCLGSGTTIIAAHLTQRAGYGLEIDPKYCDVILTRLHNFTGINPVRTSDGKKWTEISSQA
ncbi:ParB/RepB/Spo0J family partition protein [Candidatus Woesearchaeota archaeon]|nr:MAG: ParB/RepB/Spo0J family partition protein [Candidatus Woesearchaeota archaeon]